MVTGGNPLPMVFPTQETSLANYTWTDMIGGLGYKRFYGVADMHAGIACTYFLTSAQPDSPTCDDGETTYFGHATRSATTLDIDFDMTFNIPAIVMNAPAIVCFTHGAMHDTTLTTIVTIYHVRGATETSLGTATTFAKADADDAEHQYREMLSITLTRKEFAVGDKLRLNFQVGTSAGAPHYVELSHDGSDASITDNQGDTKGTNITIDIPFKVDI